MAFAANETGFDDVAEDSALPGAALFYFVQGLYGTVFVVGLLGNSLVIYVVLRYSKMQTVTNLYILNLAVADQCFLIGIPFIMTTMGLGCWPFGNVMCKIYMTTTSVNQFTSSLLLTVMSADRYIAVCHPISSPTFRTPAIAKGVALATWAVSFLMIVPIFLYAHTQQVNTDWMMTANSSSAPVGNWSLVALNASVATLIAAVDAVEPPVSPVVSCNIYWPENEYMNGQAAFTLYTFTLAFAIPLVLILVFYILVIRKLQTVGPTSKSKEKKRSHRKVTRLVLTVVTVYVLCWLPYWVSQMSLIFTPPKASQSPYIVAVFLLAGCLGYSNSAVNPILYAFLSDNFKKSFMKACVCAERREVNKALTGENSVFTRRGRNSERAPGNNGTTANSFNESRTRRVEPAPAVRAAGNDDDADGGRGTDADAPAETRTSGAERSATSSSSSVGGETSNACQQLNGATSKLDDARRPSSSSQMSPEDIPLLDKGVATIAASVNEYAARQPARTEATAAVQHVDA